MSLLPQFEFDVFLSYGWSGLTSRSDADRGWMEEFKNQLHGQLSSELGREARIYFDVERATNGTLSGNLMEAIENSAVFLSVISAGSVRPDSWCRMELDAFADRAVQVLNNSRQIFAVRIRKVERDEWPERLRAIFPKDFLTSDTPRLQMPKEELAHTATEAGKLVLLLAEEIRTALLDMNNLIAKTVYVAAAEGLEDKMQRLASEIRANEGEVICSKARTSSDSDEDFGRRVRRDLLQCGLSVHLLSSPGTSQSQDIVLREARRRFEKEPSRLLRWDTTHTGSGPHDLSYGTVLKDMGFEYLDSLLKQSFTTVNNSAAHAEAAAQFRAETRQPTSEKPGNGDRHAPHTRYLFIECVQDDLDKLHQLRNALQPKGITIVTPLFQGTDANTRRLDISFLKHCHAVAVFYGNRNDLNADLACQALSEILDDNKLELPKAVLLDPDLDPDPSKDVFRRNFVYPGFENCPSSRLEPFLDLVRRGS